MQVFISYASENQETANQVCSYLESHGKKCWIAPRDVPTGFNYGEEIIKGIEQSDAFVLLYDACANTSQHVLREVERAVSKSLPMVVYRLDDTEPSKAMEYFLLSTQWMDGDEDTEVSLEKLNSALTKLIKEKETDGKSPEAWVEKAIEELEVKEKAVGEKTVHSKKTGIRFAASVIVLVLLVVTVIVCVVLVTGNEKPEKTPMRTPIDTQENTEPTKDVEPTTVPDEKKQVELKTGDYVSFGKYVPGGEAAKDGEGEIEWQVVEAGESGIVLVSTRILAIRPYDCAESGKFDRDNNGEVYDRNKKDSYTPMQMQEFRGSNQWETSDLRTWLNSNGIVHYPEKVPQNAATDEYGNAYGAEAGFLTDFSVKEISLIANSGYGVYLLTIEDVVRYAEEGTLRLETTPTEAAIAADETSWYQNYKSKEDGVSDYIWATSTVVSGSACEIYYVDVYSGPDKNVFNAMYAAASGFGVRPAIRIFPKNVEWEGDGSRQEPYRIAQ